MSFTEEFYTIYDFRIKEQEVLTHLLDSRLGPNISNQKHEEE